MKYFYSYIIIAQMCTTAALVHAEVPTPAEPHILPLSLRDAVQQVLENNLQLKVWTLDPELAKAGVLAAKAPFDTTLSADLPGAFSRARSPQSSELSGADILESQGIDGGLTVSRKFASGTGVSLQWSAARAESNSRYATLNPEYSSSFSLGLSQPLLRDFGLTVNRRDLLVARNDLSISAEQLRSRLQDILLETIRAYWGLVFSRLDLEVKESALALARDQLRRNQAQVSIGALAPIETVQAEQAVASAEFRRIEAQQALDDASDGLKLLLNLEATSPAGWDVQLIPTDQPPTNFTPVSFDEAVTDALERDPQLRQAKLTVVNRGIDLTYYRNQRLPSLEVSGALSFNGLGGTVNPEADGAAEGLEGSWGDTFDRLMSGEYRSWAVGVSLSVPLLNYQARADHRQALLRHQQAQRQTALREQQVRGAMRVAVRQLNTRTEAVSAARRARTLAERQLEAEQRKFEVGTTSNFQVLQLQRQLAEARTQELQAVVQLAIAEADLERTRGTLLEHLGVRVQD